MQTGTRVRIQSSGAAHGLTGFIDEMDASDSVPYHVKFDSPRDGVESTWFEEDELEVIGVAQCSTCGSPLNLAINGILQDRCYNCYHKEKDNESTNH